MFLKATYLLIASAFFLLVALRQGLAPTTFAISIFLWLMIYFLAMDLRYCIVPRRVAIVGIVFGLVVGFCQGVEIFYSRLWGAAFGFLSLWCILIVSTYILRGISEIALTEFALGSGDPWLLAVIGANTAALSLPSVLFLASLQGVLAFALSRVSTRLHFHIPWPRAHPQLVPFGTFLCLATLELAIWPELAVEITSFIRSSN